MGSFSYTDNSIISQFLSFISANFSLGGTRKSQITRYPPRLALSVFAVELLSVLFHPPILAIFQLLDKSELLSVDSLLIQHISVRIRQGDHLRTKFKDRKSVV